MAGSSCAPRDEPRSTESGPTSLNRRPGYLELARGWLTRCGNWPHNPHESKHLAVALRHQLGQPAKLFIHPPPRDLTSPGRWRRRRALAAGQRTALDTGRSWIADMGGSFGVAVCSPRPTAPRAVTIGAQHRDPAGATRIRSGTAMSPEPTTARGYNRTCASGSAQPASRPSLPGRP